MNTLRLHLHFTLTKLSNPASVSPPVFPIKAKSKSSHVVNSETTRKTSYADRTLVLKSSTYSSSELAVISSKKHSRMLIFGAVSVGVALFLMGFDDHKALALGPEGPLLEDFWDNMRRYALYALTVSTGAIYALLEPILELLKNPISAVLILVILGGGFFIVSQVVTAMVGLSDFSYDYNY